MYMRASLENFRIFTSKNCYFFQYFVGTSDTLSVQMTCLSAHMNRQILNVPTKLRKSIIGGRGAIAHAPAPPMATLVHQSSHLNLIVLSCKGISLWFQLLR